MSTATQSEIAHVIAIANDSAPAEYGRRVRQWAARTQHADAILVAASRPGEDGREEPALVSTPAARAVASWRASEAQTCVLHGLPGVGKTTAALRLAWVTGCAVLFVPRLTVAKFDALDAELSSHSRDDLVVVDEVGLGVANGVMRKKLAAWLLARHDAGHRTLVTTNTDRRETSAWLEDSAGRWVDRVDSGGHWHTVAGSNLRKIGDEARAPKRRAALEYARDSVRLVGLLEAVRNGTAKRGLDVAASVIAAAAKVGVTIGEAEIAEMARMDEESTRAIEAAMRVLGGRLEMETLG